MKKIVFLLVLIVNISFAQDTIVKAIPKVIIEHDLEPQSETEYMPFAVIEKTPLFEACEKIPASDQRSCFQSELNKHIIKHFTYPEEARKANIQGRVMISFVINKKGEIDNIQAIGNADQILKNEGIRIFKLLPNLKPGTQRGKTVAVKYMMPLNFKL